MQPPLDENLYLFTDDELYMAGLERGLAGNSEAEFSYAYVHFPVFRMGFEDGRGTRWRYTMEEISALPFTE